MRLGVLERSADNPALQYREYRRVRNEWVEQEAPGSTRPEEPDFLCFLTHSPKTVVYDISLPASLRRSAEREVLFGELAARLPVPAESVCWFYRNCGNGLYRVCAVHREEIVRQLEFAASRSLKFDALIPAALADTPETILQAIPGEALPGKYRPARCRNLKKLYFALLALTVVLLGVSVFRRYDDFAGERRKLARIRSLWEKELRSERRRFGELSSDRELLAALRAAKLDTPPVSPVLTRLTGELPKTMWVTSYSQNYDSADLTLSASKDEPGLYNQIGENGNYAIVNLRKNRGYNDTVSFFVKLRIKH